VQSTVEEAEADPAPASVLEKEALLL